MLTKVELKEWTNALRANPEQQITGSLTNPTGNGFCCLGKLCQVQGLKQELVFIHTGEKLLGYEGEKNYLPRELARKFGSHSGNFAQMGMPNFKDHSNAAEANDCGQTWLEIADHFDEYYPCSDEVK